MVVQDRNGLMNLKKMIKYAQSSSECRKKMMATVLGENIPDCRNCCDVCCKKSMGFSTKSNDLTQEAIAVVKCKTLLD